MKIFNQIWQKSKFRIPDFSETLRLDIDGVFVAERHDRVAERNSLRQNSHARGSERLTDLV